MDERTTKSLLDEIDSLTRQIEEQEARSRECRADSHAMQLLETLDTLKKLRRRLGELDAEPNRLGRFG